jgi:hypothetical protein
VDGYLLHDHQKRDFQVSRKGVIVSWKRLETGKEGGQKRDQLRGQSYGNACAYICIVHMPTCIDEHCV